MKDLTVQQQKKEIKCLIGCFLISVCVNIFSILYYHTEWKELYTQYKPVLILTVVFYCAWAVIRIIYNLIFPKRKAKFTEKN
ncbi:MAG: hypothetical protein LBN37_01570 [Bacteroidales bacterium]|jgi:uncharacterized membrane protein YbhN (UPF0104 family)|nr:hypothetical protein [Bacteroidales bacterium]